ncbi:hypothetical protein JB92DRAFT_2919752, partial [Gautieria morchelliformis]
DKARERKDVSGAVLVIRIVPIFSLIPVQVVACRCPKLRTTRWCPTCRCTAGQRVGAPRVDALPDVSETTRWCAMC